MLGLDKCVLRPFSTAHGLVDPANQGRLVTPGCSILALPWAKHPGGEQSHEL